MKRLSMTCAFLLLLVVARVYAQSEAQPPGAVQPRLVIEQDTYDAGEIYKTSDPLKHDFVVKNVGTADLQILSATPG